MKKLNKKGFTLVELLAVIAILGILMVILMPNVLNLFANARKSAFAVEAKRIWSTAETQRLSDVINKPSVHFYSSDCGTGNENVCRSLDIPAEYKYCVNVTTTAGDNENKVSGASGTIYVANNDYKLVTSSALTLAGITTDVVTDVEGATPKFNGTACTETSN